MPGEEVTVGSTPAGGGETAKDPSGWSTDTLKAYVERIVHEGDRRYEQRFEAQEKAVTAALTSAALAVERAEINAEKWRANANEWRAAMTDREKQFMSRDQADSKFDALDKRIAGLEKSRSSSEGRSGGLNAGWGYLVGAIGLAATVIAIVVALTR